MSLGANRDYKTTERFTRRTLMRHAHMMADLVLDGIDREDASKIALRMVQDKALCARVYAARVRHSLDMKTLLNLVSYGRTD